MKTAVLFAGQGSQTVGMGKDIYDQHASFQNIFDKLSDEKKKIAWNGPVESLLDTVNTQPILLAFGLGVYKVLMEHGIKFDYGAGLSLGEYTALAAANVWSPSQAIQLIEFRAAAMKESAKGVETAMYAVLGLEKNLVEESCKQASTGNQIVEITNLNCPGQLVIAGDKAAVEIAIEKAGKLGAKRCLPLEVSGPFHTSYMIQAGKKLKEKFSTIEFKKNDFPILFNYVGRLANEDENISDLLVNQVSNGVKMEAIIRNLIALGVENIIEIGPGKALSGFVRKVDRNINCISITTADDLEQVISKYGNK